MYNDILSNIIKILTNNSFLRIVNNELPHYTGCMKLQALSYIITLGIVLNFLSSMLKMSMVDSFKTLFQIHNIFYADTPSPAVQRKTSDVWDKAWCNSYFAILCPITEILV